jgi:ribosome maturation factor RimP
MKEALFVRAKTELEQKVLALIEPVAQELNLVIVRVRMLGREKNNILQIMAEREVDGLLGIGECARLSRGITALIDVEDPVPGKYSLEVSSPGIDRPLTLARHFAEWTGFDARIELDRQVEGRRRFRGRLAGFENDQVLIDLEGETETAEIPFSWIGDAKLILNDTTLAKSAARQKAAAKQEKET